MKYVLSFISLCLWLGFTACQKESLTEDTKGDKVALDFSLYQASLTKAASGSTGNLNAQAVFKVYAFKAGESDMSTASAVAEGTYVVDASGKVAAQSGKALFLYRGVYDLYFVSYNAANAPTLGSSNMISINNGDDFMYTSMRNITVQPQKAGQSTMSITLANPFVRLCSNVSVSVTAAKSSPVQVNGLEVKSITMSNLSNPRSYQLGGNTLFTEGVANKDNAIEYSTFNNAVIVSQPHTSNPSKIVLPLSGSELQFTINLGIDYDKQGNGKPERGDFTFYATARKTFLPGMSYSFEFTLKFFGDFKETELTLGILEFTEIKNTTDPVGGE